MDALDQAVDVVDKKMSNSKELTKEKEELEQKVSDGGLVSIIYSAAKKVAVVGVVYFIGYMNWSVAWLLCPLLLSVIRDQYRSKHDIRRAVAKASATASDKEVILARLNDLPAWVFFPDVERCEWLNRILKQVWPNANQFTRNLIKQSIEPNVQKALAGYKLNGFKFDRMILGTIVSFVTQKLILIEHLCFSFKATANWRRQSLRQKYFPQRSHHGLGLVLCR